MKFSDVMGYTWIVSGAVYVLYCYKYLYKRPMECPLYFHEVRRGLAFLILAIFGIASLPDIEKGNGREVAFSFIIILGFDYVTK